MAMRHINNFNKKAVSDAKKYLATDDEELIEIFLTGMFGNCNFDFPTEKEAEPLLSLYGREFLEGEWSEKFIEVFTTQEKDEDE